MLDYLIFGEFDSRDYGLLVFPQNPYDANNAKVKVTNRVGRDGVIFPQRKYLGENKKKYTCILRDCNNPTLVLSEIKARLFSIYSGAQKLEDSLDKEVFYLGEVESDFVIKRSYQNRDFIFDISFVVQHQRFLKSGENIIHNPSEIMNPTHYNSHPVITFTTSSPAGSVSFGGNSRFSFHDLGIDTTVILDTDILDARKDDGANLNENVFVEYDVFLIPGLNAVTETGISDLKIVPRWWKL